MARTPRPRTAPPPSLPTLPRPTPHRRRRRPARAVLHARPRLHHTHHMGDMPVRIPTPPHHQQPQPAPLNCGQLTQPTPPGLNPGGTGASTAQATPAATSCAATCRTSTRHRHPLLEPEDHHHRGEVQRLTIHTPQHARRVLEHRHSHQAAHVRREHSNTSTSTHAPALTHAVHTPHSNPHPVDNPPTIPTREGSDG